MGWALIWGWALIRGGRLYNYSDFTSNSQGLNLKIMFHIPIYRYLLSLKYNEIRTKLIIPYVHMHFILHMSLCYKISNYCPHQRIEECALIRRMGAYLRGRFFDDLVSRVGAYSRMGVHSRGRLIEAIWYLIWFIAWLMWTNSE